MLRRFIWVLVLLLGSPLVARAAFVNGVEHFDGTVKDTATWSEYKEYADTVGNNIVQSNQLSINTATGFHAEYRSRSVTVGVGGFVQVKTRLTAVSSEPGDSPHVFLALNAPYLPDREFDFSDRSASIENDDGLGYAWYFQGDGGGSASGSGFGLQPDTSLALNQTYVLRLDYLSPTTFQYRAFDANMNLLGSLTRVLPTYPEQLFITLGTEYANATFDDVTVPEPATALLPIGLMICGLTRRRRGPLQRRVMPHTHRRTRSRYASY
jgi:hypothetical protein